MVTGLLFQKRGQTLTQYFYFAGVVSNQHCSIFGPPSSVPGTGQTECKELQVRAVRGMGLSYNSRATVAYR
jgi:hypothetical protein